MKNLIIEKFENELKSLELPFDCFIDDLTPRQIKLLYGQKYSYVRSYINWLLLNNVSLVCIANFIRPYDDLINHSYAYFLNRSRQRFYHKLENDFLCPLTFEEFRWLCANVKHML